MHINEYDIKNLNLTWVPWRFVNESITIKNYTENGENQTSYEMNVTYLYINVTFFQYAEISPLQVLDELVLDILDENLFISTNDEILDNLKLKIKMPR